MIEYEGVRWDKQDYANFYNLIPTYFLKKVGEECLLEYIGECYVEFGCGG